MDLKAWKISSLILGLLFLTALVFLFLFGFRLTQDNKIKAAEIKTNLEGQAKQMKADFQKEQEATITKYVAAEVFGSFEFSYPKVWQTNVDQEEGKSQELVFLADPNLIVLKGSNTVPTALRVIVYKDKYANLVSDTEGKVKYQKNTKLTEEDVTISGTKGKKFTGTTQDSGGKNVQFMLLPLRDKTLYIGTDNADTYAEQFKTIVSSLKLSK